MERESAGAGLCCPNVNLTHATINKGYDLVNLADPELCDNGDCNSCSRSLLANLTYHQLYHDIRAFGQDDWGKTTVDRRLTRLSCRNLQRMWFDMMQSYEDLGFFLSGFSLVSLILYFVTSSDSGSLVIDCLASNGHPEPPRLQRLLWALLGK